MRHITSQHGWRSVLAAIVFAASLAIEAKADPPCVAPTIISVVVTPDPVVQGDSVTVTATADGHGCAITSVRFQRGLMTIIDGDGSDGWSAMFDTTGSSLGRNAVSARATNENGVNGSPLLSYFFVIPCKGLPAVLPAIKVVSQPPELGDRAQYVAIDGDRALLGAPGSDVAASDAGAAFLFERDGDDWKLHATLTASDADANDGFGRDVLLQGDWAFIGAVGDDKLAPSAGAVYVFRRQGELWLQTQKLMGSNLPATAIFGAHTAVDGDLLAVSAPGLQVSTYESTIVGRVHVFRLVEDAWQEEAVLFPTPATTTGMFGLALAVTDGDVIVGAYNDTQGGSDAGAAYIFRKAGGQWQQQQKILGQFVPGQELLGLAAAADAGIIAIGSMMGVHIYEFNGTQWVQTDLLANALYGFLTTKLLAMSGGWLITGSQLDGFGGIPSTGQVRVFRRDGDEWQRIASIDSPDSAPYDYFGYWIAVSGNRMMVGARKLTDGFRGAGYIFDLSSLADCNANGEYDGCEILSGASSDDNGNGVPDECDPPAPPCPADIDSSGAVDVNDLLFFIASWGACPPPCPADFNGDGVVDINDLLVLVGAWGAC